MDQRADYDFPLPAWEEEDVLENEHAFAVIEDSLTAALALMFLGHVQQANRILEVLYRHDAFEYDKLATREYMHYAWNCSGAWPSHVTNPDSTKLAPADNVMVEQQGGQDGPGLVPHLQGRTRKWWGEMLEKDPADVVWTNADFRKARQIAASHGANASLARAASVEIALELDMDDVAFELLRMGFVPGLTPGNLFPSAILYRHEHLRSPRLWKLLCDGWLRRELNVAKTGQTKMWVDNVVHLLQKRLADGPRRPYQNYTLNELLRLFDETCLKKRKLGGIGAGASYNPNHFQSYDQVPKLPATFLSPPATEESISELEARAKEEGYDDGLPEDYKAFLRISDGIYPHENENCEDNVFQPIRHVEFDDYAADWTVELLPIGTLGSDLDVEFDWPCIDGNILDLGAGGDEGSQWLVTKRLTEKAVEVFRKTYATAHMRDRRRIERAARDLYGSVDKLLNVEHVVCRVYHWATELDCFSGFTHLLETTTMEAIQEGRKRDSDRGSSNDREGDEDGEEEGEDDGDSNEDGAELNASDGNDDENDEDDTTTASKKRSRRESGASQPSSSSPHAQAKRTRR